MLDLKEILIAAKSLFNTFLYQFYTTDTKIQYENLLWKS